MRRFTAIITVLLLSVNLSGQSGSGNPGTIKSGFYMRMGPVLPVGKYAQVQKIPEYDQGQWDTLYYPAARVGGALDMGFLIYFGPSFANNILRAGIDATFIGLHFNASDYSILTTDEEDKYKYWYYYAGQKFGPLLTINPVDRLMIDLSFKLNAYISWHHDDFGSNILQKEVGINIRYRVMMLTFLYNFGSVNYNDLSKDNPDRNVENNTVRILFGIKF